ncbi:hypothetical protein GGI11_000005 [Coemansia sp. RSA 2049]|nr:hypothetical protein GGI11_000005 [Coemansia sp. RSA 2049]
MTEAWLVAGHVIDIASIAAASAAITIIAGCMIWDRALFGNRVAFRLTLWIAVSSIVYSGCRVHQYNAAANAVADGTTGTGPDAGMRVRVVAWLMAASEVCAVLVCVLVSAHLVATVWLRRLRLAGRAQRWYDVVAVGGSLAVSHPVLYVRRAAVCAWDPRLQAAVLDHRVLLLDDAPVAWAVYLAWCAGGVAVCLGVLALAVCSAVAPRTRLAAPLKASTLFAGSSSGSSRSSAGQTPKTLEAAALRQHSSSSSGGVATQSATLRVACYGLLPLATQLWPLAYALSRGSRPRLAASPWWLYRLAHVAPSTQGMLCLLLLAAANPACDALWPAVWRAARGLGRRRARGAPALGLAFARLDASASTIHLSPYQSRQTSMAM